MCIKLLWFSAMLWLPCDCSFSTWCFALGALIQSFIHSTSILRVSVLNSALVTFLCYALSEPVIGSTSLFYFLPEKIKTVQMISIILFLRNDFVCFFVNKLLEYFKGSEEIHKELQRQILECKYTINNCPSAP